VVVGFVDIGELLTITGFLLSFHNLLKAWGFTSLFIITVQAFYPIKSGSHDIPAA